MFPDVVTVHGSRLFFFSGFFLEAEVPLFGAIIGVACFLNF